jgi:hypothetical protein
MKPRRNEEAQAHIGLSSPSHRGKKKLYRTTTFDLITMCVVKNRWTQYYKRKKNFCQYSNKIHSILLGCGASPVSSADCRLNRLSHIFKWTMSVLYILCTSVLFYDAVSVSDYMVWDGRVIGEWRIVRDVEGGGLSKIDVISCHLIGGTEEKHDTSPSG